MEQIREQYENLVDAIHSYAVNAEWYCTFNEIYNPLESEWRELEKAINEFGALLTKSSKA
jgi:hypothetical protein